MTKVDESATLRFVVGENAWCTLSSVMTFVCVKRTWVNKAAMDHDVQSVFRDASQICVEYFLCAALDDEESKTWIDKCDKNAWYEIIWYDYARCRLIVPQEVLDKRSAPHEPRMMVTEENPGFMPPPSEWHTFESGYTSD